MRKKPKSFLGKAWDFIWHDNSIWSWIVNVILAFVLIKFLIYPGLGFAFGTSHPVVAVVSSSMEHEGMDYDEFWAETGKWYEENMGITKEEFRKYPFSSGFSKGDIMVLVGVSPDKIKKGDILVFWNQENNPNAYPIIHRVTGFVETEKNGFFYQTKGDNPITNKEPIDFCNSTGCIDEKNIHENQAIGKAVLRIPFIGNLKIWFVDFLHMVGVGTTVDGVLN